MPAYASSHDLVARHDIDVIGDLATDERERLSRLDILSHENVLVALEDASGELETSMLRGKIYTPEQLSQVQGAQLGHLKRVVCYITMALLFERRPGVHEEKAEKYLERAQQYLLALQKGENLFGLPDNRENLGAPTVGGMTSFEYLQNNLIPERMPRLFPGTETRLPRSRG